ncbi:glycosyltransferase family 8 protein [Marinobacter sp. R17]|uniref:glycosyltransferase family 8 protein n=1 Tax=Marinobacter sp. R17 TaxID=2484250 RepID=UPI000F4BF526|nr:glycosyltransferase family 8 protein [Marinobacter sp. R17]ROU00574.1 glycosyltransferase family 8 protein [Marinobacter sp. R17]
MSDAIAVAACCDENYIAYAAVMMRSAVKATPEAPIHFHLINCGISGASLERLSGMLEALGSTLTTYSPDDRLYEGLPTHRYGSAVYQRINLPEYIPADVGRIIYIDADTIVLQSLIALWNLDLEGNSTAAVENLSPKACKDIEVDRTEYFNSGLLVMDLAAWRERQLHRQVTEYAREHASSLQFVDQCSLNAVLQNDWVRLPLKWNVQSDVYKVVRKYHEGCTYSRSDMNDAMLHPAIVHFTGEKKPWKRYCFHPFKTYYRKVLNETPWAGQPLVGDDTATRRRYFFALRSHWKFLKRRRHLPAHYQGK